MYSKWQWDTGDDEPPKKQMVCSWPCLPYICADQIFNQCIWWHLIRSWCRRLKNWIWDSIETTLSDGCSAFGDVLRNVSAKMMLYLKKTTLMCNKHIFNWLAVEIWNLPAEWYKSPKYHLCCSHYFAAHIIVSPLSQCCAIHLTVCILCRFSQKESVERMVRRCCCKLFSLSRIYNLITCQSKQIVSTQCKGVT